MALTLTGASHFSLCVKTQGAGLGLKPSMQGKEVVCLYIWGFYLLFWQGYCTSRVSHDRQGIDVDGSDLVLTIQPLHDAH